MKTKGINPIERHVEKLVLALFVIAALGMVALQFLGQTRVKLETRDLPPAEAYAAVERRAEEVQARLRSTELPADIPTEVPDVVSALRERAESAVVEVDRLSAPLGLAPPNPAAVADIGAATSDTGTASLEMPTPPAPHGVAVGLFGATIDPMVVKDSAELAAVVPAEQPFDLRGVAIRATFPAAELIARLDRDPDGSGPKEAMPRFRWTDRLALLDVVVERQQWGEEGAIGEPETLPPMPARFTLRDDLEREMPRSEYEAMMREARARRDEVARPTFYASISGEPWRAPSPDEALQESSATSEQADSLLRRLRSIDREIQRIESRLSEMAPGESSSRAPDRSSVLAKYSAQSVGGGGGGRSGERRDADRESDADRAKRVRDALTARRDEMSTQRATLVEQLEALGVAVESTGAAAPVAPEIDRPTPVLDAGEDVTVWTNDLTPEPGASYRYRVRVVVSNPLFGDRTQGDEGARASIESEPSEWSDPIQAPPASMLFVTQASGGMAPTGASGQAVGPAIPETTVEIFRFFYGYWRQATVRLAPGDAVVASIDVPAMPIFDVSGAAAVESGTTPTELPAPVVDAFLVDVLPRASEARLGQQRTTWEVVYRDRTGRIVRRAPEIDESDPLRLAAVTNARLGEGAAVATPGAADQQPGGRGRAPGSGSPAGAQPTPDRPSSGNPTRMD